jgi:hypothetical protein
MLQEVLVTIYGATSGGFMEVADGRMDVKTTTEDPFTREDAVKCLAYFLGTTYRQAMDDRSKYDARKVVAAARFPDHGMVYADGLGREKEISS